MGGQEDYQSFARLFMIPGWGIAGGAHAQHLGHALQMIGWVEDVQPQNRSRYRPESRHPGHATAARYFATARSRGSVPSADL